jgi:hypothetical protein
MKRRIERGSVFVVGRRGFLGGGLVGGLVGGLCVAAGSFTSTSATTPVSAKYSRSGRARPAEPWANLREEVVPRDELGPSGDELAG